MTEEAIIDPAATQEADPQPQTLDDPNPYASPAAPDSESWTPDIVTDDAAAAAGAVAPAAQPTPAAPVKPPDGRTSRKELSEQLEAAQKRLAELEANGQQLTQKHTDAEKRLAELQSEIEKRDKAYLEKEIGEYDPFADEALKAIGSEIGSLQTATVPFLSSKTAQTVISQQLKGFMDGFADAVQNNNVAGFVNLMKSRFFTKEQLEDDPETVQEDVRQIVMMARQMLPHHLKYSQTEQQNRQNWDSRREATYTETRRTAESALGRIGRWTEDEIKKDPMHPAAIISGVLRANPALEKELTPLIAAHVELAAGPPPLPRNATPAQISSHREFQQKAAQMRQNAVENALYREIVPKIMANLFEVNSRLQARLKSAAPANRPDSSATAPERDKKPTAAALPPGQSYDSAPNPYAR